MSPCKRLYFSVGSLSHVIRLVDCSVDQIYLDILKLKLIVPDFESVSSSCFNYICLYVVFC